MTKKMWIYLGIFSLLIIGVHILRFGIDIFNSTHDDWSYFGDYTAGTIGVILTFITVYLLIKQISDRQEEIRQLKKERINEKNIELLQMMLSMNRTIIDSVKINTQLGEPSSSISGPEALKILYQNYLLPDMESVFSTKFHLAPEQYIEEFFSDPILKKYLYDVATDTAKNNKENFGDFMKTNDEHNWISNMLKSPQISDRLLIFGDPDNVPITHFIKRFSKIRNQSALFDMLSVCYDRFYDKNGYLIARYFRNHYYLLEWIDTKLSDSLDANNFAYFVRSMMSSYEVVLLFYNYYSRYTTKKYNDLIEKFDLFHDLELTPFIHADFYNEKKHMCKIT